MADLEEKRIVDLSHVIEEGMTTYKGLPGPHICDFWTREASAANYDDGSTFQIGRIDMVANTGTYLDARSTAMPTARTLPSCRCSRSPTCPASSSGGRGRMGSRSTPTHFEGLDVARQGGAGPHRLGPALADRRLFRRASVPDRRRGRLAGRARRGAGRDRQLQHRRHARPRAAGAHPPARRRTSRSASI